jgi:hypothetical protein
VRARGGLRRDRAGLECETGSGAGGGEEEGRDRRAPPISAREGRKEGRTGGFGPGALSWAQKRGRKARGKTGRAGKGEEKGVGPVGLRGVEKKRRKNGKVRWAGPIEKERERERNANSNAFEFKFEI